jgi:Cu+-exporting ATPase
MEETYGLRDYSDNSAATSRDPVCGIAVREDTAPAKTGYAGQMYYFCSIDCQKIFEDEPARYAGRHS